MMLEQTINYFGKDPYPRGREWPGVIANHCDQPFRTLNIDSKGDCYLCMCESHLPISVGNIINFTKLEDIWQNSRAQDLQKTITDRTYTYCAVQHCGIINSSKIMTEYHIGINIDESCNLACPTCRRELINHTSGPVYDQRLKLVEHLVKLINQFDHLAQISMSGNGDPLASLIMRPLFLNWQPNSKQKIKLQTNGLLMRKLLPNSQVFPYITDYNISVDAGTKNIYEQVRRPGKFEILVENLEWLSLNKPKQARVNLLFVVSAANVVDIESFADLCGQFGFTGEYTKLDNWGTFDNYSVQDVSTNKEHPLHSTLVHQLRAVSKLPHIRIQSFLQNLI